MIDAYRDTDFNLTIPERIHAYLATVISDNQYNGFDVAPLRKVEIIDVLTEQKTVIYKFRVDAPMCNKDGNIHGGAATTIFDNLTSTALFTIGIPGFWNNLGVSRSLHVVFHRPLPLGTSVKLKCWVGSAGRRLTHLEGVMEDEDGRLCASCIHEKVRVEQQRL